LIVRCKNATAIQAVVRNVVAAIPGWGRSERAATLPCIGYPG